MKKEFFKKFLKCGLLGWCLECTWTGILSLFAKDKSLSCKTSLWMLPIYGLASFLLPISKKLKDKNILLRGGFYTICIYIVEYSLGIYLRKYGIQPWDYSKEKYNYKGVIRLDFIPVWFFVGLLYEYLLDRQTFENI